MNKCIYCNTSEDLSDSDIIPDGLTNAKIINKNVCRILHNNKFSDSFESYIINNLSALRDHLDIRTKGKKYPETIFNIKINDFNSSKKGTKHTLLVGENILTDVNSNSKLGPINVIESIAEKNGDFSEIKQVDINNIEIETSFTLNLEAFTGSQAKKLMAKIAYEWYCKHNNINEFYEEFSNVVNFICDENLIESNIVSYIKDENLHGIFDRHTQNGSHTLFSYLDSNGSLNVIISFFGICIYNIKLLEGVPTKFKNNCIYQEFQVTSQKISLIKQNIEDVYKFINSNTYSYYQNGRIISIAKDMNKPEIWEGIIPSKDLSEYIVSDLKLYFEFDNELTNLIISRYNKTFNEFVLHMRSLKRFVKDVIGDEPKKIILNPNSRDPYKTQMYYVLFLIGLNEIENVNLEVINELLLSDLNTIDKEVLIGKNETFQMMQIILSHENYSDILNAGAYKIRRASLD